MANREAAFQLDTLREFGQPFVPKGHPIIAQRFNAGLSPEFGPVPKGGQKSHSQTSFSFVPPGPDGLEPRNPSRMRDGAICNKSLPDKNAEFPNVITPVIGTEL